MCLLYIKIFFKYSTRDELLIVSEFHESRIQRFESYFKRITKFIYRKTNKFFFFFLNKKLKLKFESIKNLFEIRYKYGKIK